MDVLGRLPDAELEVMQALWAQKTYPAASGELMEALAGKRWRMPTLLKLLSRLEERGFVRRDKDGRSNRYTPLVRREDYLAAESREFLQKLHGGSLPSLCLLYTSPCRRRRHGCSCRPSCCSCPGWGRGW